MAQLNFDARSVAPATGILEALPAGWYVATIVSSEMKPTRDGAGSFLELSFQIAEPHFAANRKVMGRLNLRNANPTAQEIAYKDLSAICHAVGVMQVQESTQLHNIPLKIKLKVRAASGDYEASNEIGAYRAMSEQVALATQTGTAAPAQPARTGFTPPAAQAQQPQQQWQQQPMQQQQWQQPQQQQQAQQAQQQQWQQPQQQSQPWQQPQQQPVQQQPMQQQPAEQQWQQPPQGGQQPEWAQQQVQQQQPQQQWQQQPMQQQAQPAQQQMANPAQGGIPPWAAQQ